MKNLRSITTLSVVLIFAASCRTVPSNPNNGKDSTVGPNALPSSISGLVLKGPISPVARPNVPNEAPLADASITISNAANSAIVVRLVSDTAGKFSVNLPAGSYFVTGGQISNSGLPRPPQPQEVSVPANTTVTDTLHYDTGIR